MAKLYLTCKRHLSLQCLHLSCHLPQGKGAVMQPTQGRTLMDPGGIMQHSWQGYAARLDSICSCVRQDLSSPCCAVSPMM